MSRALDLFGRRGALVLATCAFVFGAASPASTQSLDAAGGAPTPDRLVGHGGPIKGIAVSSDGERALTASFDYSIGVWTLPDDLDVEPVRRAWLEGHEAAANAVVFVPDGAGGDLAISGGDDFDVIVWDLSTGAALQRLEGHQNKIQNLAISPDGTWLASASWDGDVGLWRLPEGDLVRMLDGHQSGVNDVAFSADGETLFSASSDGTIRRWRVQTGELLRVEARHGFGVNLIELNEASGWLAYGATDGVVRVLDLVSGEEVAALDGGRRPVLSMALSPDRRRLAYGDGEGYISIVSTERWSLDRDFRAVRRGPIWALAFIDDTRLLAGGLDDFAAIWAIDQADDPIFGEDETRRFHVDPEVVSNGERQFARKCSICHTLTPDGRRRAGPTLYGVFGRAAGAQPDYPYSDALKGADIIWSAETLDKLFDVGPDHYTPGSKMPMQRIVDPADRADLIAFLEEATKPSEAGGAPSRKKALAKQ